MQCAETNLLRTSSKTLAHIRKTEGIVIHFITPRAGILVPGRCHIVNIFVDQTNKYKASDYFYTGNQQFFIGDLQ